MELTPAAAAVDSSRAILVVDDSEAIRETLAEALVAEGYRVVTATDGVDAVHKLSDTSARPCLILMDLMMPRMDGMELAGRLKAHPEWGTIPIVVLSAYWRAPVVPEAVAVISKPFQMEELLGAVRMHCLGT